MDPRRDIIFWTGIMRDHAMFQINSFSPKEISYIQNSTQYLNFFQQKLNQLESTADMNTIYPALLNGLNSFIEYKKLLLKGLLTCQLQLNLPPSLINHMINEAMEFKSLLTMPVQSKIDTPLELVNMLKIWLADSVGHASALASYLDPAEALLSEETLKFKDSFNKLLTKASELEMMLSRTGLQNGTLKYLANETVKWMEMFICLCDKVMKLRASCMVMGLGTLSPQIPYHFIKESSYFVEKIKSYEIM
jgi:hypothetical protein